jgi:hypothetical protein
MLGALGSDQISACGQWIWGLKLFCLLHFFRLQKWNTRFCGKLSVQRSRFWLSFECEDGERSCPRNVVFYLWHGRMDEICKANDYKYGTPSSECHVETRGMSAASYSQKYVLISVIRIKLHSYHSFPTPGNPVCFMRPAAMFINYVPYEKSRS